MADVRLVAWPDEAGDGSRLVQAGVAVLYLVDGGAVPPLVVSCLEDWIRLPGDERDLLARVAALRVRADTHQRPPQLDGAGRLHYDGQVVALPADQAGPARLLVDRFGELVPDPDLDAARPPSAGAGGRAGSVATARPLRTTMADLRRAARDVGLTVRRVPRRGYVLQRR